jgi:hypothetical protein
VICVPVQKPVGSFQRLRRLPEHLPRSGDGFHDVAGCGAHGGVRLFGRDGFGVEDAIAASLTC